MKYYRLFLWVNGDKSTELTQYLVVPIFYDDRLNERLDSGEIVLDSMPISMKKSFAPKTKLRLERYLSADFSDEPKIWDLSVEHDDVETYEGEPSICCHRVNVIEASVSGQGMHADNMSLTYELQDVNTDYKTYTEDTTLLGDSVEIASGGYATPIHQPTDPSRAFSFKYIPYGSFDSPTYNYFRNSYFYKWTNYQSLRSLKLNISSSTSERISFTIPTLICQGCFDNEFVDLFEMNTVTKIWLTKTINNEPISNTRKCIATIYNGANNIPSSNNAVYFTQGNKVYLRKINDYNTDNGNTSDCFANHYAAASNPIAHYESQYGSSFDQDWVGLININGKVVSFDSPTLSEGQIDEKQGYLIEIEIVANPDTQNAMIEYYTCTYAASIEVTIIGLISREEVKIHSSNNRSNVIDASSIRIDASFNITDLRQVVNGAPLIMKGVKYSCYDLLRKALLTIDTQIIDNEEMGIEDIEYPVILDPLWENRLKTAKVQETILETKNLWEILLQIGYYLHAIPYFEFSKDGTDRFMLSFRQLGDTKKKNDTSKKITVFNSKNLSEYFTQYDSYVTNIFSPQNLVEEWLVIKTTDSSYLVSNNTSILKTTYGISEIVEFDITYDGSVGGQAGTASALSHIFEKSIYQILTADYNISPGMGDSIYYELGQNTISGLTYIPPSPNNDMPMALKRIVGKLFSGVRIAELKFNNLKFHIKYRTQDSMRVSQVRPDLKDFVKNSSYEKYPHHEQFFGQQDKIVDSERFSLNLFGKLVRVGNDIYQCQEMVIDGNEKESGDLVEIDGEPYYVTEVENEFYPEMTLQKVTYSKNFNQLSQIVTIPSEPRFYEVSERSKIRREKREFDFIEISTTPNNNNAVPTFMPASTWQSFIKKLIFNKESVVLPNYAWTRFKVDKKRVHKGAYGQYVPNEQMFPSSELDRTNPNQVLPKSSSDHADVIVPVLHFPMKDGIVFEWDMEDNFKAGDSIDTSISGTGNTDDEAYYAMQSVRYCDVLGRADLYTFRLFNKTDWNREQSQALPKACIEPTENQSIFYLPAAKSIALDKDCREALSFNYQISLLHRNDDGYGDFITFTNLFGTKESELYCCLLDDEVSMFNENTNVIPANVLADNVIYNLVENLQNNQLEIHFETPNVDLSKVKAIVFYEIDGNGNKVSYLAKNFKDGLVDSIPTFYIFSAYSD